VKIHRITPPATVSFDQQSSLQVNAVSFLFSGYTLAIRSQDITGFGAKKIGISLAIFISRRNWRIAYEK
jgi:hypothetical protein